MDFDPTSDVPLADAAVEESMRRVEERRAAGGKLNSGGTLVDLTNATAATRNSLANDEFTRRRTSFIDSLMMEDQEFSDIMTRLGVRSGLETDTLNRELSALGIGFDAASGNAAGARSLGSQIAGITQGQGNATAAGIVGGVNARNRFFMDIAGLGALYKSLNN